MAEVRAAYLQLILRQSRNLPEGERILARLSTHELGRIREAGFSEWLPFSLHQALQDAKNDVVGEARAAEVTRTLMMVTLASPLVGGFVTHVLHLLGADPRPAIQWMPRGYAMILRGCGRLEPWLHPSRRMAIVRVEGMEPEVAKSPSFVVSLGHALSVIYPLTGFSGRCDLRSWDEAAGTASFELTWDLPFELHARPM
ncbi:MAG: hypothetical protein U0441_28125 [Polyangiaceae bacterium]